MVNDTLSDILTQIRNGCLNNSERVSIPLTRLSQQICHTLEKEGFIESFQRDFSLPEGTELKNKTENRLLIVKLKYKDFSLERQKPYVQNGDFVTGGEKLRNNEQIDRSLKNPLGGTVSSSGQSRTGQSKKRPSITNLKRISKPGLRIYARHKQIPTVLGGLGILILSTPKGIMTDREARFKKVGGEILCSVW